MKTFLRVGTDTLEQCGEFATQKAAIVEFGIIARELDRYGQKIEASLHFAPNRDLIAEYPDRVLSLTARGAIKVERT